MGGLDVERDLERPGSFIFQAGALLLVGGGALVAGDPWIDNCENSGKRQAASRRSISRTHALVSRTVVSPVKPKSMLIDELRTAIHFALLNHVGDRQPVPESGNPLNCGILMRGIPFGNSFVRSALPQNRLVSGTEMSQRSYVGASSPPCLRHLRQATQERIHLADVRQLHRPAGANQGDSL